MIGGVLWLAGTGAWASPPACDRSEAARFAAADAVVEAKITSSRRWASGPMTFHLVAKYRVLDVFKGGPKPGEVVIVTDTCLDRPVPQEMLGYPVVDDYCLGGMNLSLTGVDHSDGRATPLPAGTSGWVLYLREDRRVGAPELTWIEVGPTGYYGYGPCDYSRDDLPSVGRSDFDRLHARLRRQ